MQTTPTFIETAKDAVRVHAQEIRQAFFDRNHAVSGKADATIVTETDLAAERAMRAFITERHPTHAILGEEFGQTEGTDEYRWVLDPIDGTRNFTRGVPLFVSAAALLKGDEPVVAAIYHPIFDELTYAERGKGAFQNDLQLKLETSRPLNKALINFDRHRSRIAEFVHVFEELSDKIGSPRVYGSALYTVTRLAAGSVDAMVMLSSNLWDIMPGLTIATEAGATTVDFWGKPWTPASEELILAHPDLVREIVRTLNKGKGK